MGEDHLMHRSLITGPAAGVGRIFHWPISRQDAAPLPRGIRRGAREGDREIAAVTVDLDLVDDDRTAPEEGKSYR
jgi:hypothetical protein